MRSPWNEGQIPNSERYDLHTDVPYAADALDDPMRTLWLSLPRGTRGFATVVWVHGGGFAMDQHECPDVLFDGRRAVVDVRHRIIPNVKVPDCLDDGAAAIAWVLAHIADYGGDPSKVFVGGMSAGAYLAAIVGMDPGRLAPYGFRPQSLAGLILISGQMTTHFQLKVDLGYAGDRFLPVVDRLAPLAHLSPDLPPILVVTGEPALDIAARPEENAFAAASLRAMGHRDVECHALSGHGHVDSFESCGVLVARFLARLNG